MNEQVRLGAYVLVAFGVLLLLASLFADQLALGQPGTSFGWKQLLGSLFGLVVATVGLVILRRPGARNGHQ